VTPAVDRTVRRRVLTPDDVGDRLAAGDWTALDAYRWRDPDDRGVLPWPMALATLDRRERAADRARNAGTA